eukprot:CAMPEP_0194490958 /NCGR_PEP_ID=MMETSP0253-20130528/10000_1 /TAXON_ID=2966 /ORGANISM="Noctiluca scintillans" /LENGTH=297 /DNA_ID=CAMNT_0039331643 /DNA_START=27 /DNA_END=920 /DNA_ORIENTATION=-
MEVQNLFVADMIFSIVWPLCVVLFFAPYEQSRFIFHDEATFKAVCMGVRVVFHASSIASMLFGLHISVVLACQFFRWRRTFPHLKSSVVLMWPLSCLLGVMQVLWTNDVLQSNMKTGECVADTTYPIFSVVILLTFSVSLASYMLAATRATRNAPLSVKAKLWSKAMGYPLNFVITSACLSASVVSPSLWKIVPFRIAIALTMSLNGVTNSVTYFLQSRHARQGLATHGGHGVFGRLSFSVDFARAHEERHTDMHQTGSILITEIVQCDPEGWEERQSLAVSETASSTPIGDEPLAR